MSIEEIIAEAHKDGVIVNRQEAAEVIYTSKAPYGLYAVAGITSRMPDGVYAVVVLSGVLCIRLA